MRIHEIWLQSNYLFFFLYYGGALCQFVEGLLTYLSLLKLKKKSVNFFLYYLLLFQSVQGTTCCSGTFWNDETSTCEGRINLKILNFQSI